MTSLSLEPFDYLSNDAKTRSGSRLNASRMIASASALIGREIIIRVGEHSTSFIGARCLRRHNVGGRANYAASCGERGIQISKGDDSRPARSRKAQRATHRILRGSRRRCAAPDHRLTCLGDLPVNQPVLGPRSGDRAGDDGACQKLAAELGLDSEVNGLKRSPFRRSSTSSAFRAGRVSGRGGRRPGSTCRHVSPGLPLSRGVSVLACSLRASDRCQHPQFYRPVAGFTDSEVVVGELGPCEATSKFMAPRPWSSRTARPCMTF